jgi:hypothetical protein
MASLDILRAKLGSDDLKRRDVSAALRALQRRFEKRRQVSTRSFSVCRPGLGAFYDRCEVILEDLKSRYEREAFSTEKDFIAASNLAKLVRMAVDRRLEELSSVDADAARAEVEELF